jgi:hypothetical protein
LRKRLGRDEEFLVAQEQLGRRQHRPRAVAAQHLVAPLRVGPELADRPGDIAVQQQDRVLGQVVEQCRRGFEKQRQVVLDAGRQDAVRNVLVQADARGVALEGLAEALAEGGAAGLAGGEFACRQKAYLRHRIERALRIDVEAAQGFDLVVEQLDAVGQGGTHRKQVDQPAAHAEFARGDHLGDVLVAGQRKLRPQFVYLQARALLHEEGMAGEEGRRCEAGDSGRGRRDQHLAFIA